MMKENAGCIITGLLKMRHLLGKTSLLCPLLTNKSKIKTKVTAKCFPVVSKLNLNYLLTTWKNS